MASEGGRGARGREASCRAAKRGRSSPGRAGRYALVAVIGLAAMCPTAFGQLSGQFGLDLAARRIPSTLTDEIALDTPSEFAELEFGLSSNLALEAHCGFADITLDSAVNMAGAEHAVGIADVQFTPISVGGTVLEDIHLSGEMWFAVPFEGVTDVNNLPNWVVIPPGDPLFVTARFAASFEYAGFKTRWLFMLQDVEFPNPSASFTPLYYDAGDQSFGIGNLVTASWTSSLGSSLSIAAGLNASQSATVIKGYSATGRVDPGNCFLNASVGGIRLCDASLGFTTLTDAQVGLALSVSTTETLSATLSFSAKMAGDLSVGTSITLLTRPYVYSGLDVTGTVGCFRFGVALDELELKSLSARWAMPFSVGALAGSLDVSATGIEKGLTGLAARLSVSQGLFSAGTNVAFAQRGNGFGFASLGTQLAFRIPPGTITVQATFSRYGLTRASVSTGVSF